MPVTALPPMTDRSDLVIRRIFDAPLAQVWEAWVNPERVMQWWGPDRFTSPSAEINFHEGETSLVCMRAPREFGGQDFYSAWAYTKIVPLERIEYTHTLSDKMGRKIAPTSVGMPDDFPQDQRHTVTFEALGDNVTEMTVTEYGWPPGPLRERAEIGLEQCLAKMAALFAEY